MIGKDLSGTAQQLAWTGMDAYEDGEYKDAIDYFQQLKDHDSDWWDTLSDYDKQLINKGVEQLNEEKGIYHNDVKGKVNKLLSEDD